MTQEFKTDLVKNAVDVIRNNCSDHLIQTAHSTENYGFIAWVLSTNGFHNQLDSHLKLVARDAIQNLVLEISKKTKTKITNEEVKRLILEEGLILSQVIDVVVEINSYIGVGIYSLGDDLRDYCRSKA